MRTFQFPLSCALVLWIAAVASADFIEEHEIGTLTTALSHLIGGTTDGDSTSLFGSSETRSSLEERLARLGIPHEFGGASVRTNDPSLLDGKTAWFTETIGRKPPLDEVALASASHNEDASLENVYIPSAINEQAVISAPAPPTLALDIVSAEPPDISTLTLWVAALVALMSGLYYWQRPRKRRFA